MEVMYDGKTREEWEQELSLQRDWNIRHILSLFALLGIPNSLLDVGCGDGAMVKTAKKLGVDSFGIDQLIKEGPSTLFLHVNLVDKFLLISPMNMVLCLEVAEHLDQSAHATLCDTLAENLAEGRGNYLVFSAAFPNQGGMGHVSERPSKYWQDQFSLRNLNYRKDLTVGLSLLWSNIGSPLYWLPANVMVFEK